MAQPQAVIEELTEVIRAEVEHQRRERARHERESSRQRGQGEWLGDPTPPDQLAAGARAAGLTMPGAG